MPKLSLAKLERHLYSAADRLRQEGLDAATYKDYIFGLLFLKRCSDVFDAEREKIVGRKIEQGMAKEPAEQQYGENSDFYDTFFVPERARWQYLQSKLADASESYGSVLDKALGALSGLSHKILNKGSESGILSLAAGGKDGYETASRHTHQRGTKSIRGLCQPREKECARDYPSADVTVV